MEPLVHQSSITPTTARRMAAALFEYDAIAEDLKALRHTKNDAQLVRVTGHWARAAREINDCRKQLEGEERAAEIAANQAEIFGRNLAWLKRHHPDDPRIPRIEASLGGGS